MSRPDLAMSIVVVAYDMQREANRTVRSLRPPYQRHVPFEYEVIVVDNGSPEPLRLDADLHLDRGVRLIRRSPPASVSPAAAMNVGVGLAASDTIGVVVDGARLASPGLVAAGAMGRRLVDDALVGTLAWHLGPDTQARSVRNGYDRSAEDALLDGIAWPSDGDRLVEIAHLAPASARGYILPLPESSAVFLSRGRYERLGGLDERFESPGGGLVASDFWRRAVESLSGPPVILLGEGTFHQLHGAAGAADLAAFRGEYERVTGRAFAQPAYEPILLGLARPNDWKLLGRSAVLASAAHRDAATVS